MSDIQLNISIKEENLLAILNNLLDNAIDACKKESDKKLFIQMITIKSFLKITIKNSCSENVFLQNPHLETKKSDRSYHGFGLKIVQKIAKSYHGTLRTEQIDDFFLQRSCFNLHHLQLHRQMSFLPEIHSDIHRFS